MRVVSTECCLCLLRQGSRVRFSVRLGHDHHHNCTFERVPNMATNIISAQPQIPRLVSPKVPLAQTTVCIPSAASQFPSVSISFLLTGDRSKEEFADKDRQPRYVRLFGDSISRSRLLSFPFPFPFPFPLSLQFGDLGALKILYKSPARCDSTFLADCAFSVYCCEVKYGATRCVQLQESRLRIR